VLPLTFRGPVMSACREGNSGLNQAEKLGQPNA
jgi:hypothetical protein